MISDITIKVVAKDEEKELEKRFFDILAVAEYLKKLHGEILRVQEKISKEENVRAEDFPIVQEIVGDWAKLENVSVRSVHYKDSAGNDFLFDDIDKNQKKYKSPISLLLSMKKEKKRKPKKK